MNLIQHKTLALTAAAALIAACAQPGGSQRAGEDPCNPVVGAVIGGALGALIGGDRNRGTVAAIGAGVGALACVTYNHSVRQTKTAEQVGAEYKRSNKNQLPPVPTITAYRTEASTAQARGGDEVTVTSNIEVVPGRAESLKELREEFAIVDPNGVERSKLSKTPAPSGSQGGAFVSTLQFTFPKGIPAGPYAVQSRVFVNGKSAQASALKIQVALDENGTPIVALAR